MRSSKGICKIQEMHQRICSALESGQKRPSVDGSSIGLRAEQTVTIRALRRRGSKADFKEDFNHE